MVRLAPVQLNRLSAQSQGDIVPLFFQGIEPPEPAQRTGIPRIAADRTLVGGNGQTIFPQGLAGPAKPPRHHHGLSAGTGPFFDQFFTSHQNRTGFGVPSLPAIEHAEVLQEIGMFVVHNQRPFPEGQSLRSLIVVKTDKAQVEQGHEIFRLDPERLLKTGAGPLEPVELDVGNPHAVEDVHIARLKEQPLPVLAEGLDQIAFIIIDIPADIEADRIKNRQRIRAEKGCVLQGFPAVQGQGRLFKVMKRKGGHSHGKRAAADPLHLVAKIRKPGPGRLAV